MTTNEINEIEVIDPETVSPDCITCKCESNDTNK